MSQGIGVVGAPDFTTGFRLAGVNVFENVRDAEKDAALDEAVESMMEREDVGIVIMHAEDMEYLSEGTRRAVTESVEPTVVTIGGDAGADSGLREQIKRAIGIDLMDEDSQ